MGFLDKVKNMFTEEIEETPIKKDVIQVEIPAPIKEEKKEEEVVVTESEVIKKEEKPSAPVFFDDNDFANLERKEEKKIVPKVESKYKIKEEEKKIFKPTPIISPVYGVLDKNYHKEDITPKRRNPITTEYEKAGLDIDKIRKKAFGTLEDELETIIPSDDYEVVENKGLEETSSSEMFDDLMDPDYEPRFAEKASKDIEIDVLDDIEEVNMPTYEEPESDMFEELHEEVNDLDNDLSESDLFNLIDSMYDKKEDE